ncbi:MAG: adenylate/guanylate cyclase domain-containing protein [Chromatiales bacterium]|nr:adenylate/guanylate cyclase domain-containing protein [Chromatiales bacterium]
MEGRSAELTVLFADIRSFTALSEGLSPQELARLMNEYFSAMTAVIRENRGTLDKYVGDAIMAFWGAPVDDALHARHAVAAGLQMQRRLTQINVQFETRGWPKLAIGVGINTGVMTVGDMGSRERKAYTVLGDAVNLGSRFEGLTAHYGVGIIIGEATQRLLRDMVCREIDRVRVKGRAASVAIFEPVGTVGGNRRTPASSSSRSGSRPWHSTGRRTGTRRKQRSTGSRNCRAGASSTRST